MAAALVALATVALAGMVLLSARSATVLEGTLATTYNGGEVNVPKTFVNYDAGTTFSPQGLFENSVMDRAARVQQLSLATTYNGGEVNVPKTVVNYEAGTTFSPQGLFENSVMDRAARIQQLSNGDAHDDREQVDLDAPHETKYIGTIAVDETVDGMARPMGDVKHLDCYGRDDDPDCQTSAAPLFDKAQATSELSTKASDDDLAAYFAQQQKQAERARKPITPKMQGAKKLADSKGTKFGLSAKAARQQANAIFGGAAHKQMKQQKTQLKLDTRAADKQVDAIFTDISMVRTVPTTARLLTTTWRSSASTGARRS